MKRYTVAVCVDDNGGMTFNGRRQSRDRVLLRELCETARGPVYVSPFSAKAFPEDCPVTVLDDPFVGAPDGAVLFIESLPLKPHLTDIDALIIYRWNRSYPRDTYLDLDPVAEGFSLISSMDFVGSSHEKITKEIYKK